MCYAVVTQCIVCLTCDAKEAPPSMGLSTCIAYVSVLQVKRRATRARYAILATLRLLACGGASPQPAPAVQVVGAAKPLTCVTQ